MKPKAFCIILLLISASAAGQGWHPIFIRDCKFRYDSETGYNLYAPWKGTRNDLDQVWKHNQDGFKILVWGKNDYIPPTDSSRYNPKDSISIRFLLTNYGLDFGGFDKMCDTVSISTYWSHEHILRNKVWVQLPKPDEFRKESYKMEHSILYGFRMWAGGGCPYGVLPSARINSMWSPIQFRDFNEIKIDLYKLYLSRDSIQKTLEDYILMPEDIEDIPTKKILLKAFNKYWLFPHPIAYQMRVIITENDGTSRSVVFMFYVGETLSEYMLYGTKDGIPHFNSRN